MSWLALKVELDLFGFLVSIVILSHLAFSSFFSHPISSFHHPSSLISSCPCSQLLLKIDLDLSHKVFVHHASTHHHPCHFLD